MSISVGEKPKEEKTVERFRFKPEDFDEPREPSTRKNTIDFCVNKANRLLEEHEKTLLVVYQDINGDLWDYKHDNDTHTALLWNLEELNQEEK